MTSDTSRPAPYPASRTALVVAMIVAAISGAFVAIQSRITGELGKELGDGYLAALLAFVTGLVILAIAMLFWAPGRQGLAKSIRAVRTGSVPWWHFSGGAAGAFFVLSQGLTAAMLGVALFTVAAVCGQTISGLLIDRNGLGTVLPKAVTYTRLIGSIVAFCAVVWAVSAQLVGNIPIWALAMPFIAGLGAGWQQAVNGQVRGVSESALTATVINFLVGTMILLVAAVIHGATAGWPTQLPSAAWLYLGGPIGVVFIAAAAILVRTIGVLLLGLGTVAGQLTASLLVDVATPIPGHTIAWTTIAGTILTLLAVAFAAIPSRAIWPPRVATER